MSTKERECIYQWLLLGFLSHLSKGCVMSHKHSKSHTADTDIVIIDVAKAFLKSLLSSKTENEGMFLISWVRLFDGQFLKR